MSESLDARVAREREAYEAGLRRERYDRVFGSAGHLYSLKRQDLAERFFSGRDGQDVLEIGSTHWASSLEVTGVKPRRLACINIAENEIDAGRRIAERSRLSPEFVLMDAHRLAFADETFDVVLGGGILHHLDLERAIREVHRVLRPDGAVHFIEPLGINPVGRIVRRLTPAQRTADERPISKNDLEMLGRFFELDLAWEQLMSVPAGVAAGLLRLPPDGRLMRTAFAVDEALARVPLIARQFRFVVISGVKRTTERPG